MACYYHKNLDASGTCCNCGKLICEYCMIEIDGRMHCKACISELIKTNPNPQKHQEYRATSDNRQHHYNPHADHAYHERPRRHSRYYSGFLTFLCSCLPGAGHMFLGLITRGMFFLALFFLSSYLAAVFDSAIAGFAIVIIVLVSLFDAFRIRRLLNDGIAVNDDFDDVLGFLRKYSIFILILFAIDILRIIFERNFSWGYYGTHNSIFAIIIILFGIYVMYNLKLKKKQSEENKNETENINANDNDFIDKR